MGGSVTSASHHWPGCTCTWRCPVHGDMLTATTVLGRKRMLRRPDTAGSDNG
jgi:hypothetical protein